MAAGRILLTGMAAKLTTRLPASIFPPRVPVRAVVSLAAFSSQTYSVTSSMSLISASPEATDLVAHYFAAALTTGDCYLLYGDIGAGKSTFRYIPSSNKIQL
jgi:hypothetical protein